MDSSLQFVLLDMEESLCKEWQKAFERHVPENVRTQITVLNEYLERVNFEYDVIVSPANSYGRLDGSFDHFLALAIGPSDDYYAPTKVAQAVLYKKWKGFAPPGTCTLVPLEGTPCEKNPNKVKYVALCPTMRTPEDVNWDKEVVYECTWSLLNVLHNFNKDVEASGGNVKIKKIVFPGLATGVGGVSAKKCAQQMAMAFRDFADACSNEEKWSNMSWGAIQKSAEETRATHNM